MKRPVFRPWLVSLLLFPLLASCLGRSPAVTFYTLTALPPQVVTVVPTKSVGIGPIALAAYLDRPEIVTRTTPPILKLADNARWGEPLDKDVGRVLTDNLGTLLAPAGIRVVPWDNALPLDPRIALRINRFERDESGQVLLAVDWTVIAAGKEDRRTNGTSRIVEDVHGESYSATVEAMSRALAALSRELAGKTEQAVNRHGG